MQLQLLFPNHPNRQRAQLSMNLTTFNSFKNKNFRLFFSGQFISLLGTWMQKTAVSWLVYSITQSKFMLGVSVFATLFPTALFSLYGGIVADRYDRYKILVITQFVSLFQAILMTLAVIFFKENIVWWIISLSVMLGIINGFDVPARQSLVRELIIDKADLPNALALNSSMVNLSKLIGPAIAGFVLEQFGDAICFGSNAVSFIAVLISLFLMQLPQQKIKLKADKNLKKEFTEAFLFIKNTPTISSAIIFTGLMGLFVLPFSALTPVFAKDIFKGSASTLGVVDGVIGLGAFLGALFLASLKNGTNLSKILAKNSFLFGIGLLLFSQTNSYPLALVFLIFGSFGMMSVRTITNTIVQVNVHNEFRGRVISIYLMVLTAMVPIGSLLVGSVSHYIGVQTTVLIQAILAMIISVLYIIYLRKKE
ncbi:MFS transporter [Flavobacterium cellulosilyticum]|uniref:MFS transporter n=1 Tax=Flavobacterium cellulosilyticum TaxID=2541731 RepID=A0A4R5C7M3_9FLAO|nr:MFS transporter [Flavobacterium cellulosilyticum]TDD94123.1 MFS transporter [Flavobacterium cellulosilyticum]